MDAIFAVFLSIVAGLILKAIDKKVTALFEKIKKSPYEAFVIAGLCVIIAGMGKLLFLLG